MTQDSRIEKKFVYEDSDISYLNFLISGHFKKIFPDRKVNSIYFDTFDYKNVWDNINGFSKRSKIRLRWYNEINDSKVFIEKKDKLNFTTIKNVEVLGKFINIQDLFNHINNNQLINSPLFNEQKLNLKKVLYVSYDRSYYQELKNRIRITIDKKITIFLKYPSKKVMINNTILEIKYNSNNCNYCNNFIKENGLNNRNQKFSKYVNSFLELNESGYI